MTQDVRITPGSITKFSIRTTNGTLSITKYSIKASSSGNVMSVCREYLLKGEGPVQLTSSLRLFVL
jgi:hypothetical protein